MRADPRFRLNWTWGFYLETLDGDRTRLLFRTRAELTPWWMRAIYRIVLVPADFVMGRSMCLGIRKRVIQAR